MVKHSTLIIALLLASGQALAEHQTDADGFTNPLQHLQFNPGLDQQEFERASNDALQVYDPLEAWNRRVYHFNYRFDQWVFLPVVDGYRYVTPSLVQSGVHNFFNNLGEIPTLANSVLQLKGKRAANSTARLLFNTIFGIGGIWGLFDMFRCLRQRVANPLDNGMVEGNMSLDDKAALEALDRKSEGK